MDEKVSSAQLEELVDYMVAHPMLAKGVGLGPRSKETVDLLWAELTQRLNARGLGAKNWSTVEENIRGTGGGPPLYERLSEVEKKVLGILEEANHLDAPKTATLTKKDPKPQLEKKKGGFMGDRARGASHSCRRKNV
ncbi:hypothetical protein EVAR_33029_1 [Eumeta japonica]|uniref:Regulatory protein zeste n=1 Tax=Eumeta variegata TaxID=151549 RepID=A0A4C1VRL0_EUMVA|nr:hypothetical protein EVAR_33029_1 [Eumeta japonica]